MTGWDGERGEGETEWERSNGWKRRGEGKRGTRDALSQGELLSFFVAALQKDRTKERNAREPGPGPFRGQFENPFRSVRDLFVYARNTRRSPLSSQPIRSRYHFTWPGGEEEAQRGVRNTRTHPQGRREEEAREILDPTIVVSRRPSCLPPFRRRTPTETMSHDLYASGERFLNLPRFGVS